MFKKRLLFLYGPLFVWMGVIFYLSSVPGGNGVYEMPLLVLIERKLAHVAEYAILTLFIFRVVASEIPSLSLQRKLIVSGLFSLLYACSDEIHQLFVRNRTGKLMDVFIDGIGIVLMSVVLRIWLQKRKKN